MNNVIDTVKAIAKTNPVLDYYRVGFETDELKLAIESDRKLNVTRVGLAQEELNVYFDGFLDGRVIVKTEDSPFGAGEVFPVRLYRKLPIIEGGVLTLGMFAVGNGEDDVVDLTKLPLVNPDLEIPESLDFAEKLLSIEVMKARYKVLNYFIKQLKVAEEKPSNLKSDEFEWLKTRGFVGGSYNPPKVEKKEKEYKHRASTTVKGWSALPSVEELVEAKSKAKTGPRVEMRRAYEQYHGLDLAGLQGELNLLTNYMSNTTRYVTEVKLAITVCGKWFPDAVLFPRQKLICADGTAVFLEVVNRVED